MGFLKMKSYSSRKQKKKSVDPGNTKLRDRLVKQKNALANRSGFVAV